MGSLNKMLDDANCAEDISALVDALLTDSDAIKDLANYTGRYASVGAAAGSLKQSEEAYKKYRKKGHGVVGAYIRAHHPREWIPNIKSTVHGGVKGAAAGAAVGGVKGAYKNLKKKGH